MKSIRPLRDRVVIREPKFVERSIGSIILPDAAMDDAPQEVIVESVGEGRKENGRRIPVDACKKGDTVLVGKHVGVKIEVDGVAFRIISENDVLGVVKKGEKK